MARVWQLLVKADGDTKAAQRELKALQRSTKNFGRAVSGIGKTLTTAVTAPLIALGVLGVSELRETMAVTTKTDAVFKSMGDTMKVTKGQLSKLVTDLERYSAIEGDIIQNAANVGLSFKALASNPELFDKTTRAAVDMSAALGTDLQTTMVQLGKAMQNGAKGAGALAKNGTLAKDDIAKLQAMAKAGVPIWKQQEFILAAVNKQYAGQGKNVDPLKAIAIAVKNVAETLAILLLPAITKVSAWLQTLATYVTGLSGEKQKWVGVSLLVAAALGPILMVVGAMITAMAGLIVVTGLTIAPLLLVAAGVAAVIAVLVVAYAKSESFRSIVDTIARVALVVLKAILVGTVQGIENLSTKVIAATTFLVSFWTTIAGGVKTALAWIRDSAAACWTAVISTISAAYNAAVSVAAALSGAVKSGFAWIRDNANAAWSAVKNTMDDVVSAASSIGRTLAGSVQAGIEWIRDNGASALAPFKTALSAIDTVCDNIVSALASIKTAISDATSSANSLSTALSLAKVVLPAMARGGITSGPTLAGEAGREAVIPLGQSARETSDRARVMRQSGLAGGGGSGGDLHVHVDARSGDVEAIVRRLVFEIMGSRRVQMGGSF